MKDKKARPWDILNKNIEKVSAMALEDRLSICRTCMFFISATQQCKKCGCYMPAKASLPHAECPKKKWGKVDISTISYKESNDEK
jgi:hypothetical protein